MVLTATTTMEDVARQLSQSADALPLQSPHQPADSPPAQPPQPPQPPHQPAGVPIQQSDGQAHAHAHAAASVAPLTHDDHSGKPVPDQERDTHEYKLPRAGQRSLARPIPRSASRSGKE